MANGRLIATEHFGQRLLFETRSAALKVLGQDGKDIDLVFSDVFGFELSQELHRRYPHIKTLLTSGFPGMFLNRDGIDGTGFTVLRKPYMRADLAEAVRAALDQ